MNSELSEIRKKIDEIDRRIVDLLNRRAELVIEVGRHKERTDSGRYVPEREQEVYERVKRNNTGPLPDEAVTAIYREIMSASLALEGDVEVFYLGPPGTYSHMAAEEKFGSSVRLTAVKDIPSIFAEVQRRHEAYGVVPVENSTEGGVSRTLDMFVEYDLKVCAESVIPIHHNLLQREDGRRIKVIYSIPQVFSQCRKWIAAHHPHAELADAPSSAAAAAMAARDPEAAAIASEEAARLHGLKVVARNVEDRPGNATRFLVIAHHDAEPTGRDKTSIVAAVKDEVGALYDMLQPFKNHGINLTRIESRPAPAGMWDYYFFVDMHGHRTDPPLQRALQEVKSSTKFLKVLGSYPAATRKEE